MTHPNSQTNLFEENDPQDGFSVDRQATDASAQAGTLPDGGQPRPCLVDLSFLSPPLHKGELGRLGAYRILEVLGQGGMGLVFRAEDPHLQRAVAVKVMRPQVAANPQSADRFLREARAAAAVKHDQIVTIYQVGQDRGVPFMALEYLKGEPLDRRLKKLGRLLPYEVMRIGHQIALGLVAAHEAGLIHRDIKPANIWLEAPTGRVKILDFGLARLNTDEVELTGPGAILGTPAYMSPEQADGRPVDQRSDLFSLGVLFYRMITGELPFKGASAMAILSALISQTPKPPIELVPECPVVLNDLILQMLTKDVNQRNVTAPMVAAALAPALQTVTVVQYAPTGESHNPDFEFEAAPTELQSHTGPLNIPAKFRFPWRTLIASGFVLLATIALAAWIVIKIRNPDGTETVINVPDKANVTISGNTKNVKIEPPPKKSASRTPTATDDASPLPVIPLQVLPQGPSPFDVLDASRIPESERVDFLPKETVAVIGSHTRRTWGSSFWQLCGGLSYSPDGKYLVAVDFMNMYVFNAGTMKLITRQFYAQFGDSHRAVAFSPDSRILYMTKQIVAWDVSRDRLRQIVDPAVNKLFGFSVAVSPDGRLLACGSSGDICTVVDISQKDAPIVFQWKTTGICGEVAFSPDGNWMIASDKHVGYHVFHRAEGKWEEKLLVKSNVWQARVGYSFTGTHKIALVTAGGGIQPVDLSGEVPRELEMSANLDQIVDFAIDSTGEKWVATRHDYLKTGVAELILGDWRGNELRERQRMKLPHVGYVAYAPDGKSVASHGYDHSIHVWDITQDPPVEKDKTEPEVNHTRVSPDGSLAASLSNGGQQLILWDWSEGQPRQKHAVRTKLPQAYVFWVSETRLMTSSHAGLQIPFGPVEFTLWDITPDGPKEISSFTATEPSVWQMSVSPDGTRFVHGNVLWDLTATPPKQLGTFKDLATQNAGLDFSPDSKWLIGVSDGQIKLFDASKPEDPPVATVADPGGVKSVKFAPDGTSFLTLSAGFVIRWERKGKELVETFRYTNSPDGLVTFGYHLTTADFSPDGTKAYIGDGVGIIECDAKTGVAQRMWRLPGASYPTASKDGRYLFLSNVNGTGYVLRLSEPIPITEPKK